MASPEERNARLAGVLDTQFSENPYSNNAFSLSEAYPGNILSDIQRAFKKRRYQLKIQPGFLPEPAHALFGDRQLREEDFIAGENRLRDPMQRIFHEIFWFWPETYGSEKHPAGEQKEAQPNGNMSSPTTAFLAPLAKGDLGEAEIRWSKSANDTVSGTAARHNIAVLAHIRALSDPEGTEEAYTSAFALWKEQIERADFRKRIANRIVEIDDPRLSPEMLPEIIDAIPKLLLSPNVRRGISAAYEGEKRQAFLHAKLLSSSFAPEIRRAVLAEESKKQLETIRELCRKTEAEVEKTPWNAVELIRIFLKDATPSWRAVETLLGEDADAVIDARNSMAGTIRSAAVSLANATENWDDSLTLQETAESVCRHPGQRMDQIREDMKFVRRKVSFRRRFVSHRMDVGLPWDENAPLPETPERKKATEKDQEKKKSPLSEVPERKKETEKAQESEAGGSAAAAKTRDHGVGSFWKTHWTALAAIAAFMLLVFMQLPNPTLVAWGSSIIRNTTSAPEGKDFVAIAAGWDHSLALRKDGSIVAWDTTGVGQTNAPSGTDFVAIAAGEWHSLALRKDGSIVAWGNHEYGQTNVPAGKDFIAIAAGGKHSLALRGDASVREAIVARLNAMRTGRNVQKSTQDARVAAWGNNEYGQTNVPEIADFVAIAAGERHNIALRKNGSLTAWGDNKSGQTNVPAGTDFVAVAAGTAHNLALRRDGSLATSGDNKWGQTSVPSGKDFVAIAAGTDSNLALRKDGSLVAWGEGFAMGRTNVPKGTDFVAIAVVAYYNLALRKDGSLAAWGHSKSGQMNIPKGKNFVAIAVGGYHCLALRKDGSIAAWGDNKYGQTNVPKGKNFVAIAAGEKHSLALRKDGSIAAWGDNSYGQTNVSKGNDFVAIAAGGSHSLALRGDASVREAIAARLKATSTGRNIRDNGQDGFPAGSKTSTYIPKRQAFVAIAARGFHNLALRRDGSIVAWGDISTGQANVPEGKDFVAIAAGMSLSLALRRDGSIVAWGDSWGYYSFGQTNVPTGKGFVAIAAGGFHSLALQKDGSIAAWGGNKNHFEANVPEGNDFVAIAAGTYHSLALRRNGSIVAWGDDKFDRMDVPWGTDYVAIAAGEDHNIALLRDVIRDGCTIIARGNNDFGQTNVPEGYDFVAITAGKRHSLALRKNGSIVAWGDNSCGQTNVPAGTDFVAIAAGEYHSLALRKNGSIVAWGDNSNGETNVP